MSAKSDLPAQSSSIATDVNSSRKHVRVNGHERVDVAMAAGKFEVANQALIVLDKSEDIT